MCVCVLCLEGGWGENLDPDISVWGEPMGVFWGVGGSG